MNPDIAILGIKLILVGTILLFWWVNWRIVGGIFFKEYLKEYPKWSIFISFVITVISSVYLTNGGVITQLSKWGVEIKKTSIVLFTIKKCLIVRHFFRVQFSPSAPLFHGVLRYLYIRRDKYLTRISVEQFASLISSRDPWWVQESPWYRSPRTRHRVMWGDFLRGRSMGNYLCCRWWLFSLFLDYCWSWSRPRCILAGSAISIYFG